MKKKEHFAYLFFRLKNAWINDFSSAPAEVDSDSKKSQRSKDVKNYNSKLFMATFLPFWTRAK